MMTMINMWFRKEFRWIKGAFCILTAKLIKGIQKLLASQDVDAYFPFINVWLM